MGVGCATRGGRAGLVVGEMRSGKVDQLLAAEINSRQSPLSQYDCDNNYRNLSTPNNRGFGTQ